MSGKKTVIDALEVVTWVAFLFIAGAPAIAGFFMGAHPYKSMDKSGLYAMIGLGIGLVSAVIFTGLIFLLIGIYDELRRNNHISVKLYELIKSGQSANKGGDPTDSAVAELSEVPKAKRDWPE